MVPRSWSCHDDAAIENSLHAIERGFVDQRLEIAAGRHAIVRALDSSDVNGVPHHRTKALRREHESTPRA
jgi:hypothetical protein